MTETVSQEKKLDVADFIRKQYLEPESAEGKRPYLLWKCPVCDHVWPTWRENCHNCWGSDRPNIDQCRYVHPDDLWAFNDHQYQLAELESRKRAELSVIPSIEDQWAIVESHFRGGAE